MATLESVVVEEAKIHERPAIDREKVGWVSPWLALGLNLQINIKIVFFCFRPVHSFSGFFCSTGHHNALEDYSNGQVPPNELQIYTWMDATLKEISNLVKEVNPDARRVGTQFEFALVQPDYTRRVYRSRIIGQTISGPKSLSMEDNKTLTNARFTIGDYMDIAITPPSRVIPGRRPGGRY